MPFTQTGDPTPSIENVTSSTLACYVSLECQTCNDLTGLERDFRNKSIPCPKHVYSEGAYSQVSVCCSAARFEHMSVLQTYSPQSEVYIYVFTAFIIHLSAQSGPPKQLTRKTA